jgi:hypothetical protein
VSLNRSDFLEAIFFVFVFVFADKTKNVYETTPENYNKIVKDNVTKTYKLTYNEVIEEINFERTTFHGQRSYRDNGIKRSFCYIKRSQGEF